MRMSVRCSLALPSIGFADVCSTVEEGDVKDASANYLEMLAQAQVRLFAYRQLSSHRTDSYFLLHRLLARQEATTSRTLAQHGATKCFGPRLWTPWTPTRASLVFSLVRYVLSSHFLASR